MPHQTQLRADDPGRVGRYLVVGRVSGIPSDDPIYLGTAPDGGQVAISILGGSWARDAAARDRFAAEAAVAKRVPPFCAARVLDAGVEANTAYLVSEYIPGPSLLEAVYARGTLGGVHLDAVAIGMATGLASVHQAGLVHGHFGPEYVILPPDGPLRVVEFAITPPYGPATPSADMLAWAQTVFFAASGRPPGNRAELGELPGHLRDLVEECMDADPAQRPTARAVVTALLQDATPAAGVLAEGSLRSTVPAGGRREPSSASPTGGSRGVISPEQQPTSSGPGATPAERPVRPSASARPLSASQPPPVTQRLPKVRDHAAGEHAGAGQGASDGIGRAQRTGSHQQPPRHSHRAHVVVGSVLVVAVLGSAALIHLTQDNGSPKAGAKAPGSGLGHGSPSPASARSSPPATPAVFAGTWRGRLRQLPNDVYSVSVVLTDGGIGGSVSYSGTDVNCSGSLTLTQATSAKLVMSQAITKGGCDDGTVTITLTASASIHFSFSSTGPQASGTLTKA